MNLKSQYFLLATVGLYNGLWLMVKSIVKRDSLSDFEYGVVVFIAFSLFSIGIRALKNYLKEK